MPVKRPSSKSAYLPSAEELLSSMEPVDQFDPSLDFGARVRRIQRPYIPLSDAQYHEVLSRADVSECDIFEAKGMRFTFGSADQGWALMPMQPGY